MIIDNKFDSARARALERAVKSWENEGGARGDRDSHTYHATIIGEAGDDEALNIRIRLIALENIVVALLASGTQDAPDLAREMAQHMSSRLEATPHRLTIAVASNMMAIVERAEHCPGPQVAGL